MTTDVGSGVSVPAPPVVIHGGFPKTATTSLQHGVFAGLPGIVNLGRPEPAYDRVATGLRSAVLCASDEGFEAALADLRAFVRERAVAGGGATLVLSDEHIATGHHTSPYATQPPGTILGRLARLFPQARILMVLRAQPDVLMAEYVNQLRMAQTRCGPDAWLDAEARKSDGGALAAFDYGRRLAEMRASFGSSRVHLHLYEDMTRDPATFAAHLGDLLGVDGDAVRTALDQPRMNATTPAEMAYLRLRRYVPRAVRRAPGVRALRRWVGLDAVRRLSRGRGGGNPSAFGPAARAALDRYYAQSNETLSIWLQRNLADLGYPTRAQGTPPATGSTETVQAEGRT